MLCATGLPESRDDWQLQIKFDGIRGQLRAAPSGWTLRTRPGADRTDCFPELSSIAAALGRHRVLLDGEIVVFARDGRPDFGAVRRRLTAGRRSGERTVTFVIWDVMHLDGRSARALPLLERQALLADLLPADGDCWCLAEPLAAPLADVLSVVAAHQLEGVVAKRLDSRWEPGRRTRHWRKLKVRRRRDCTVAGWLPATDSEPEALLVRDDRGRPAGDVTFGLTALDTESLRQAALALADAPRGKRRMRRVGAGLVVTVDAHGADGQPLRDLILRGWRLVG
jgi:bifunctional non-homologous end joining protein LigD